MIAWIVLSVITVIILLMIFLLLFDTICHSKEKRGHKKAVYSILYHYAEEYDRYLLNDVELYFDSEVPEPEHYDHILFGEKYIYVIQDFSAFGGIYGNSKDSTLFLRDEKSEKTTKIDNPLKIAERKVMLLEAAVGVSHEKHLFQSFTVYNNSLLVPPTIQVKDGANSLLPLKDLIQTIIEAEKDSVTSFEDQKTKDLVLAIKERSDAVKKDVQKRKKLAKKSR